MSNNDKSIASFLVSIGVFSAAGAASYVGALSLKEKRSLLAVSAISTKGIEYCGSAGITLYGPVSQLTSTR